MSAVYSWSRVQYSLCVSAGYFLSQKHDERVVGTLEILCLLFNHYVEDLDIATLWEHSAVLYAHYGYSRNC